MGLSKSKESVNIGSDYQEITINRLLGLESSTTFDLMYLVTNFFEQTNSAIDNLYLDYESNNDSMFVFPNKTDLYTAAWVKNLYMANIMIVDFLENGGTFKRTQDIKDIHYNKQLVDLKAFIACFGRLIKILKENLPETSYKEIKEQYQIDKQLESLVIVEEHITHTDQNLLKVLDTDLNRYETLYDSDFGDLPDIKDVKAYDTNEEIHDAINRAEEDIKTIDEPGVEEDVLSHISSATKEIDEIDVSQFGPKKAK